MPLLPFFKNREQYESKEIVKRLHNYALYYGCILRSNNRYKILIVEDEENIQTFVSALLEANGYGTVSAYSYREGKTLYFSHVPDLQDS